MEPHELFKGEVEEVYEKVKTAHRILLAFKTCFETHRDKLDTYFTDGQEPKLWEFTPKLVFWRYDKFLHLVETVLVSAVCISYRLMFAECIGLQSLKVNSTPGALHDRSRLHEAREARIWRNQGQPVESGDGEYFPRVSRTLQNLHGKHVQPTRSGG